MWTIWYNDSTVHGESLEEWKELPNTGVVAVYQYYGRGEDGVMRGKILSGTDWYWMLPDGTIEQNKDTTDIRDHWVKVRFPKGAVTKKGIWVTDEKMEEVEQELVRIIEG